MNKKATVVAGTALIVAIFFVVAGVVALPIMWLWDYVMPAVFDLPELTFWQALWGLVMVGILRMDIGSWVFDIINAKPKG